MPIRVSTGQVTLSKPTKPYACTVVVHTSARGPGQSGSQNNRQFADAESPEVAGLIGLEQYRAKIAELLEAIDDATVAQFAEVEGAHRKRRRYHRADEIET